jgi:hypothetical protein
MEKKFTSGKGGPLSYEQLVSKPVKDYSKCGMPDQKESSRSAEEQKSERLGEVRLKEGVQWRDYVVAWRKPPVHIQPRE